MRSFPLLIVLAACDAPDSAECDTSQDPCESGAAWISACESFPTIQGALDAAVDGTTVRVCRGHQRTGRGHLDPRRRWRRHHTR